MPENQITFRTDPRVKTRLYELVADGEYGSISDFVNQAIQLKMQVERIAVDGELPGPEPWVAYFETGGGRALLRELIREAREA